MAANTSVMPESLRTLFSADLEQVVGRQVIVASAMAAILIAFVISSTLHRAFFSPLSNIPGPRLAGITYYYEAYWEVWLGGQYFKKVAQLHEQYGPIVRITPHEIHWNDPEFIDKVYPGPSRKTNKPVWFAERTGTPHSIVSTIDHDLHRQRRNALNSFFSVASVRRLEPIMKTYLAKMMARLEQSGKSGEVVQIHHVFMACASDIITQYAFGECLNFIDERDYGRWYFQATDWFFFLTHVFALAPGLVYHAQNIPKWSLKIFAPFLKPLRDRQDYWIDRVREIRESPNPDAAKSTIFEGIFNSSLPPKEKIDKRLASEAQLIVFAGEGTTAHSLTCCVFHLLDNPDDVQKLRSELSQAKIDPDNLSIAQVDNLPFLCAVIQEAVRLHPGVMARQVRISPNEAIVYKDPHNQKHYVVPPNTVTSMSSLDIHMHPKAFGADAYEFRPQRWIDNPSLSRYFIGFSRGTRNCVGMTLARREMAMILASLFSKYDVYRGQAGPTLELYNTERKRDIDANSDYIIPVPAKGSKGLQIKIRN